MRKISTSRQNRKLALASETVKLLGLELKRVIGGRINDSDWESCMTHLCVPPSYTCASVARCGTGSD